MTITLKNHEKKFRARKIIFEPPPDMPILDFQICIIFWNMSFFQSCSILTFYSLKWPSQWVGAENIYVEGYFISRMVDTASVRAQKGSQGQSDPFGHYQRRYHPYGISSTSQHIYFLNLLIERVILSYTTLKSNNTEKMTYNANLNF